MRGFRISFLSKLLLLPLIFHLGTPVFAEDIPDPIEPINRAIFSFNDTLDEYLFVPVAKGYDYIMPNPAQRGVSNFFQNLDSPIYIVSDLLQLKFSQAGDHTARFLINSTLGILGFLDVAEDFGISHHPEDIGSAFGNWGMGPGFYIVLPILGPSSLRDGIGFGFESFLTPTVAVAYSDIRQRTKNQVLFGSNGVRFINIRSRLLDPVESAKEAYLDYYSFVKNSYQQNRLGIINDGISEDTLEIDDDEVGLE
jgi:phospholipid-binding lipoprotein MlaA